MWENGLIRNTGQKIKFSIKDLCSKFMQFPADLVNLLKKSLMENFIFGAVKVMVNFKNHDITTWETNSYNTDIVHNLKKAIRQ